MRHDQWATLPVVSLRAVNPTETTRCKGIFPSNLPGISHLRGIELFDCPTQHIVEVY